MPVTTRHSAARAACSAASSASSESSCSSSSSSASPPASPSSGRTMTSAIPHLSVTELRRGLDGVRRAWAQRARAPFALSADSVGGLSAQELCLQFLLGQHRKRRAVRGGASA